MSEDNYATCSFPGYKLEAKVENFYAHKPVVVKDRTYGEVVLSTEWRPINAFDAPPGVGVPQSHQEKTFYVYSYETAMALAWALLATHAHKTVLVRIVPYRIEYKWKEQQTGEPEVVGFGKHYGKELKDAIDKRRSSG